MVIFFNFNDNELDVFTNIIDIHIAYNMFTNFSFLPDKYWKDNIQLPDG